MVGKLQVNRLAEHRDLKASNLNHSSAKLAKAACAKQASSCEMNQIFVELADAVWFSTRCKRLY
jgi:hypothetical protein